MFALLRFFLTLSSSLFKSKSRLEAENAALRRQVIVLQRKVRGRLHFTNSDRLFLIQLYRWFPSVLKVITIIRPETVVRWHRAGFRRYWRWKSRCLAPEDSNSSAVPTKDCFRLKDMDRVEQTAYDEAVAALYPNGPASDD